MRKLYNYPLGKIELMGAVAEDNFSDKFLKANISNLKEARFCFEGGNLIPSVNQKGEKIYLCGAQNVLLSVLNSHYIFSKPLEKKQLIEKIKSLENSEEFSKKNLLFVQKRLQQADLLSSSYSTKQKEWIAKLTIASKKVIEERMQRTLGHPVLIIGDIFEAPIEFHLDMYLLPGPDGIIFMQDLDLCKEVLCKILKEQKLTNEELSRATRYVNTIKQLQKIHGPQLKQVKILLEKAGYQVVSVPGVYYKNIEKLSVNMLNSIIGIEKDHKFCISNGSSHPVDRFLRDAFAATLNAYGVSNVYFTGKNTKKSVWEPLDPNSYPAAQKSLDQVGGIHCRTQEISSVTKGFKFTKSNIFTYVEPFKESFLWESLPKFYDEMIQLAKIS